MAQTTYFKIGAVDYSNIVAELKVNYCPQYKSNENVNRDLTVEYINTKREVEVSFIPLETTEANQIINALTTHDNGAFMKEITILEPKKSALEKISVIPSNLEVEYYTINQTKKCYKGFSIKFKEL